MGQEEPHAAIPTHRTTPTTGRDARWRGPVPHETTTKEKARDKDDDRRQKKKRSTTARGILLECGGENHPHERRAAPARVADRQPDRRGFNERE